MNTGILILTALVLDAQHTQSQPLRHALNKIQREYIYFNRAPHNQTKLIAHLLRVRLCVRHYADIQTARRCVWVSLLCNEVNLAHFTVLYTTLLRFAECAVNMMMCM